MSEQEIDRQLAEESEGIEARWERGEEATAPLHRNRPRSEPSLIYSLRMPASRLEQLRTLAERAGVPTSALMRQWVMERLDVEAAGGVVPDPRVQRAVRLELERAGLVNDELMEALRAAVEIEKERRAAEKPPSRRRQRRAS